MHCVMNFLWLSEVTTFSDLFFTCSSSQVPLALPSLDALVKESLASTMKEGQTEVENI